MYFVYVLYSKLHHRFYTGMTGDLERRLSEHNKGQNRSTKAYRPWQIVYYERFADRVQARKYEKYLKTGSGRAFIQSKVNLL